MKKLIQWTYFLDILGYGEKQKEINNKDKAKDFIEFMKSNKLLIDFQEDIDKKFFINKDVNIYEYYDFKSTFISDSFVITAIPKDNKFAEKKYYHYSTLIIMELTFKIFMFIENILEQKGLIIRGGISNKFTDIDVENSLAVGIGLIEAYKLESIDAVFPRILLTKDISEDTEIMSYFDKHSKNQKDGFSIFCKDVDGFYYLNYFGFMLSLLYKSEHKRIELQHELESKYGITFNFIKDFQEIINDKESEIFRSKLEDLILKYNIDIKVFQDSSGVIKEYGEYIHNIQNLKYATIKTFKKHKEVVEKNLKISNKDIIIKYTWLKNYHNRIIDDFKDLDFMKIYKI
jgi:hypothetical protein